ncbi:AAC(3) family N-acetyltransferase [bacterium]|nr:AAC(3) family N-acetyltransferase [bacterium]
MNLQTRMKEKTHVSKEEIESGLRQLGLQPGALVMVHSSLSSFGYVEGGAETVIDSLLETVGPEGTVMVPTYSINRRRLDTGEEEFLPYDAEKTPVWTGTIPETFRKRTEAIRSANPTHSLAAIGPKTKELIEGLHRLVELDGLVLMLGVDLRTNSTMHLSEGIAKPPQYLKRLESRKPKIVDGREVFTPSGPWADFTKMEEAYIQKGIIKIGKIGDATIRLLKAKPMVETFAEALRQNSERFYGE